MAEESLRIKIGADVADFEKAIDKVEKDMKGIQPVVTTTGKSFSDFGKQVTVAAKDIQKLPDAAGKAGNVLSNLSRVASDAPFGFIAIQNNLDPLIDSFGRLQRESGGTGTAIKALAGSLAGPAGLALGFSVVSSLITTTIQKYGSLSNALDILLTSNNELVRQQQTLNTIRKQGIEDAGAEIAQLDVLIAVSQDATNSQENRVEAARKLIKVYGEYLPNVKEEALLNNQAAAAINAARDAILNRALAAAAEKKVGEIGSQLLDIRLKQVDAEKALTEARKQAQTGFSTEEFVNAQNDAVVRAEETVKNLRKEYQLLQGDYNKLITLASGFAKQAGGAFIENDSIKQVNDQVKQINKVTKSIKPVEIPITFTKATITQGILQADAEIEKNFRLQEGINIPVTIEVPRNAIESLRKFGLQAREALDLQQFRENVQLITNVFTQVFSPAIDQFFDNLGQGKNILKTLGESVKQFVIGAIKQFVKLAAVAGLISLVTGVPFSASFKAVAGGGGAGGFFGGGFSGAAPLGGLTGGGIGVNVGGQFNIRGTDLVAVVNQGTQRIGRVG